MFNNWEFVATIEHKSNGNIVRCVSDIKYPLWAKTTPCKCDHCMTNRYRKDTYLIHNTKTDSFRQVGKNCLMEYTGGLSVEAVASAMSIINLESYTDGFSLEHDEVYYDPVKFLMYVNREILKNGYVSKSTARINGECSTVEVSLINMNKEKDSDEVETEENREFVTNSIEWLKDQNNTKSDYIYNTQLILEEEYITYRDLGYIAAIIPSYTKYLNKLAEDKKKSDESSSEFVGNIKDKITVKGECKLLATWGNEYSYYGSPISLYSITDDKGNIFTWRTSKELTEGFVALVGTVKNHTVYRGIKQTELTRCKEI